uniref:Rho GTPase-activating protein 7-like n=1 Tax=Ananas comosus var. bracteatus TaxID=296719 RepID=A0A6V7PRG7_ANACO|nr:unnamed protein product [Ananas comosus var. bracteatus]
MSSPPAAAPLFERQRAVSSNTVYKSGPLFISSKGIGWKSWKKRWFILTRTSLVFFKNDPVSTLLESYFGGIDINNSGSVVVREDKKLLTVLFPDGRDGRAFTLKAESSEDLFEWKTALEQALAQAPSAALVMGHNGIFRNDNTEAFEGSIQHWREKRPTKSLVVGRPILLALEDIDGGPSFLEKALRFLEKNGTKVEGILRQAADVEEVDRRVREYEQGRTEFAPDEDAHVVGDCVKHVLRELPSSPVPASCCTALLEAHRLEQKEARINAMRSAISETFPEPNRRLLQRVLKMMHTIASHTAENRMTPSAVSACMAPLLLRPLLAGECEMEDEFDVNNDNSAQLLAAANAANNAQAIITTLLEDYETIFDDDNPYRCSLSPDSQAEDSGSEESTVDENIDIKDNGYHDAVNDADPETDIDAERVLSGKLSGSSGYGGGDLYDCKVFAGDDSDDESHEEYSTSTKKMDPSRSPGDQFNDHVLPNIAKSTTEKNMASTVPVSHGAELCVDKHPNKINGSQAYVKRSNFWGRNNARKNQSMESIDSSGEEELAIQRLEITKNDLQLRIAKEARGNAILQASLERRKQALHERRLALEQDVLRLQEQLQAERDLRAALEVGLSLSSGQFSNSHAVSSKARAELEEIALAEADVARLKQKVAELHLQLNQQHQQHFGSITDASNRYQNLPPHLSQLKTVQHDFDATLAFCNHEKKQRTECGQNLGFWIRGCGSGKVRNEAMKLMAQKICHRYCRLYRKRGSSGTDWRSIKQNVPPYSSSSKQFSRKHSFLDTCSSGLRGAEEASTSNTPKPAEGIEYPRQPSLASSTLVELTTRLDFFRERRSQLMEQLHNLDLSHGNSTSQGFFHKPSPPWTSPR